MSQNEQTPLKRSRAGSTVAPNMQTYRIPTEIMSNKKNLNTILGRDKNLDESKYSVVDNYFFKTRYDSAADIDATLQLRPSNKPVVQNKLHLDLPTEQKVSVKKYVGQEKQFQQNVESFFTKIFKSCLEPQTSQNFQECEYCEHRYYENDEQYKEQQRKLQAKQRCQPYVSHRRLLERQKQPVQVFFQQITNQPIYNNRWKSTSWSLRRNDNDS